MPRPPGLKRLLLLRHAKAEPAEASLEDIDRPLSARGRHEARDAAHSIAEARLDCDALLSSPAVRARQTASIVARELDLPAPTIESDLYPGEPGAILRVLRRCPEQRRTVLLVGHNPGISELAQRFHGAAPPVELHTAGLCLIELSPDTAWVDLRPKDAARVSVLR